jgi:hypothetical protein
VQLSLERVDRGGSGTITIRLLALNDTAEEVWIDRRLLVGPNALSDRLIPVSREPAAGDDEDNEVLLNPGGLFGRERTFADAPAIFHGYLLVRPENRLLPQGPVDATALALAAEPLVLDG